MISLFKSTRFFEKINLKGELQYYLKDLYIFLLSTLISVMLAELLAFEEKTEIDFVDRIFGYIYFLIPIFSLSLVASYIYRNKRIKETGKVRSSLRYRLTLAFVFVSMLPSIPIFLFSSNFVGKMVESFYRIDISEALKSSRHNVRLLEAEDRNTLFEKGKKLFSGLSGISANDETILSRAIELRLLDPEKYYIGIIKNNLIVTENLSLFTSLSKSNFKKKKEEPFENFTLYRKDKCFFVIKIQLSESKSILLGKRIHSGNEENIFNIVNTESSYNTFDLWKERVPFALRLALGLFSVTMFGLSILLSLIMARRISRPIVQLATATQRISLGDTDVKLSLKEEGEMGILIDSFNQMTKDLKSKNEELMHTQRIAAWKEVAQRMAHEIKNPLTPIQLSAERIRKRLESPEKNNFEEVVRNGTDTIIGQVRVLEHLVKEFSEFARMPNPILINQKLNPIVEESIQLFRGSTNVRFETKLSKTLPELFLDKRLFLGVVNNLIKNAIEAIEKNNEEISGKENTGLIVITTKMERKIVRKFVVLLIEDNGPGLSGDMQSKIFEPYFSTKEEHGTGIGLTIVEKTVLDHHGHISIEKSHLGGCCFRIELPIETNS
ncbi:MAG: HAMP domain-containing protein [Leptospira sp.]|nr:HAMP domain-containing protein [Leptospira sp.]